MPRRPWLSTTLLAALSFIFIALCVLALCGPRGEWHYTSSDYEIRRGGKTKTITLGLRASHLEWSHLTSDDRPNIFDKQDDPGSTTWYSQAELPSSWLGATYEANGLIYSGHQDLDFLGIRIEHASPLDLPHELGILHYYHVEISLVDLLALLLLTIALITRRCLRRWRSCRTTHKAFDVS